MPEQDNWVWNISLLVKSDVDTYLENVLKMIFLQQFQCFLAIDLTGAYQNASVCSRVWILRTCVYCMCLCFFILSFLQRLTYILWTIQFICSLRRNGLCYSHEIIRQKEITVFVQHVFVFLDRIVTKLSAWEAYNKPVSKIKRKCDTFR